SARVRPSVEGLVAPDMAGAPWGRTISKSPPARGGKGNLRPFHDHCDSLPAADACRSDAPALLALPELDQERVDEPRPGGPQRVPETDRPAVHVHLVAIEAQVLLDREVLSGEGFVDLEQVDVVELEARALECLADRRGGPEAHDLGRDTHRRP